ncbi:hypothetical protein FSP39_003367 [Pinctada imbricata]|uniref:Fibrinogen C-terminal domain-containing protein n=1 Tax=Pinctada imbricata TaxID=66713 RepID=A0AA88YB44_PINIB|nr:hypothetical protein FSP39_003367 [Pinctada imbricata]
MESFSAFFILVVCISSVSGDTSSDDGRGNMNVFQKELLVQMKKLSNAQENISRSVDNYDLFRAMSDKIDNLEEENKKLKRGLEILMNNTILEKKRTESNTEKLNALHSFMSSFNIDAMRNISDLEAMIRDNKETLNDIQVSTNGIQIAMSGNISLMDKFRVSHGNILNEVSNSLRDLEITTKTYERFGNDSFAKLEMELNVLSGSLKKLNESSFRFFPKDCQDIQKTFPVSKNGVYRIYPYDSEAANAYCDMTNGGWTVFQRRQNGKTNFYRGWNEYKSGFGSPGDEYWLGNSYIHSLTINRNCTLRIDLTNWDNISRYATYTDFRIENEADNYRLRIGSYSGNAGHYSLSYHNNQEFTTKDRDNDKSSSRHCAVLYTGAWWYNACHHSNLNGDYSVRNDKGVRWWSYPSSDFMKTTTMKLKCT